MVSSVRDEHEKSLKTCTTVPERNLINTRIDKANEKIQVCMCMYIYVCTCMCISMYGHVCISTHVCICLHVCVFYVPVCTCIYKTTYMYM